MPLPDEELDYWESLAKGATRGPWIIKETVIQANGSRSRAMHMKAIQSGVAKDEEQGGMKQVCSYTDDCDGMFLLASRRAVLSLVAEVRTLREELMSLYPRENKAVGEEEDYSHYIALTNETVEPPTLPPSPLPEYYREPKPKPEGVDEIRQRMNKEFLHNNFPPDSVIMADGHKIYVPDTPENRPFLDAVTSGIPSHYKHPVPTVPASQEALNLLQKEVEEKPEKIMTMTRAERIRKFGSVESILNTPGLLKDLEDKLRAEFKALDFDFAGFHQVCDCAEDRASVLMRAMIADKRIAAMYDDAYKLKNP